MMRMWYLVRRTLSVLAAVLLICSFASAASETLTKNPGFEEESDFGAENWVQSAWVYDPAVLEMGSESGVGQGGGRAVYINCIEENDARFEQTVSVEPSGLYRISGGIRTDSMGVTGYGASFSVLDTFSSTDPIFNTNGQWVTVEMYGRAGAGQKSITVCARVGFYGDLSTGKAWFDNFHVEQIHESELPAGAIVSNLSPVENRPDDSGAKGADKTGLMMIMIICAALFGAAVMTQYKKRLEGAPEWDAPKKTPYIYLACALGLLVRVILAANIQGYETDIACFAAWMERVAEVGPNQFYQPGYFCDYPPGYLIILYPVGWLVKLLHFSYGTGAYYIMVKLPSIIAEVLIGYFLYKWSRDRLSAKGALLLAAFYLFNPAVLSNSSIWGQIDGLFTLFVLLSLKALYDGKVEKGTLLMTLSVLIKPQGLIFGPIIVFAFIKEFKIQKQKKTAFKRVGLSVLVAAIAALAVILPFTGNQQPLWIVDKYFSTIGSYSYVSLNAFNFYTMFGLNWEPLVAGGVLEYFGYGMIGVAVGASAYLYFKSKRPDNVFFVALFLLFTVYMFAPKMHERYLYPVLAMLLLIYAFTRDGRLILAFCVLSVTHALNIAMVMIWVHVIDMDIWVGLLSALQFGVYVLLAFTGWDLCVRNAVRQPAAAREKARHTAERQPISALEHLKNFETRAKFRLSRLDMLLMCGLTLVYAAVALPNLGSTDMPGTYWKATGGKQYVVKLSEPADLYQVIYMSGIGQGNLSLEASCDGQAYQYLCNIQIEYGDMYNWLSAPTAIVSDIRYLRITPDSSFILLYEMAFRTQTGEFVPVADADPDLSNLFDEQDQVKTRADYLHGMYFDEIYHARTAYEHINGLPIYEITHPPLGKTLIALGVRAFGMNPFGWRVVGTVFGILMVPAMYLLGKALFQKPLLALLTAWLFTFDFMHFTQTRIATIDVYAVFFIMLMYLFMYLYLKTNFNCQKLWRTFVPLGLCGISFGLGISSKWIDLYAGAGLAVLFGYSFFRRYCEYKAARRALRDGEEDARYRTLCANYMKNAVCTLLFCAVFFIAIPLAFYVLSYLPYMPSSGGRSLLQVVLDNQKYMFNYHSHLSDTHPFASPWYEWPLIIRPIWFYSGAGLKEGMHSTIASFGSPAVWWAGLVALIALIAAVVRRKARFDEDVFFILVALAAQFMPWLLVSRTTFIYHYFASIPFIILCAVWWARRFLDKGKNVRYVLYGYMALVLALFFLYYPALSGLTVPAAYIDALKIFPSWIF